MKKSGYSKEFLVGSLVLLVMGLLLTFGWLMGAINPFRSDERFHLLYAFAGGVEVGSPVRVSGVKVGKVEKIEFISPDGKDPADRASLKITISVSKKAAEAVRNDSRFYVNMAGIIGERYIEISPGSRQESVLAGGSTVRGVDPPRIDQLLSQGYGVFGRIQELLDENEKALTEFVDHFNRVLIEANQFFKGQDRRKLFALVENMNEVTLNLKGVTKTVNDPEFKEVFKMLAELVKRAHQVDKPALKKFLQEEGVRARIF